MVEETKRYDSQGRQLLESGLNPSNAGGQRRIQEIEVEDVTDQEDAAAQQYKQRMEDEYAKREGGA